ncbi:MAG: hypothetical protein QOE14_2612 [Humisphaera sp.]|nr:hypothetical protein [Humisphaera sp.]
MILKRDEQCNPSVPKHQRRIGRYVSCVWVLLALATLDATPSAAADPIVINGPQQASIDQKLPAGGLPLSPGVANIQVFRASRAAANETDGKGWTYHHHVDLAAWKGRLYLAWNSTEKDEDVWPSRELFATSTDGFNWSPPSELFPMGVSTGSRMYFFCAPNGRMLAIAGLRTSNDQMTERKKGALVVREILSDHTLGPVHVLRPPANPDQAKKLPRYQDAADATFVEACNQLLVNKPFLEQADYGYLLGDRRMKWHDVNTWPADEPSRGEFERFGKAMSFYHRKDGALVAVMKWGWVLVSRDEGETWSAPVRPKTFVSGMAKAWGQRTADGRFALVYNPDLLNRFPLVVVSGDDGIAFERMRVVHGDVPPIRYPGLYKAPGPQYVRGISEWSSDGSWTDAAKALWVCYSVNKEDIWVSRVPLPLEDGDDNKSWNTYSPRWAPISVKSVGGVAVLQLEDRDPGDWARATKVFATPMTALDISFDVRVAQGATETLHIEFTGPRSARTALMSIKPADLAADQWVKICLQANCADRKVTTKVGDSAAMTAALAEPVDAIVSLTFRTGDRTASSPEQDRPTAASRYEVKNLVVRP